MTSEERLQELRQLFMDAPESASTRAIAIVLSLLLVAAVLWLVRRRTLREEYTPIWMAVAFGIAALSLVPPLLGWLTRAVGAWTPSSTLFFFGELFLLAICLNYAVRLSGLTLQLKNLAQELAVLRGELEEARALRSGERSR
jgi:drug/metabolite transporter (DMT)-like permease